MMKPQTLTAAALLFSIGSAAFAQTPAPKPAEPSCPMIGVWSTINNEGYFEPTARLTFTKDGKFTFQGSNYRSAGSYTLKEGVLLLVWSSIDGEPVEPGTVRRTLSMPPEASTFRIDKYTYAKRPPAAK